MHKPLFLFVGKSSSGKTTVADILEQKHEYKQVNSYCTRKPRYDGEIGHVFISDAEFDNLGELVAYTEYNNHRYGTTTEQVDQCSTYVIDVPGVKTLLENYKTERKIVIIYFDSTVYTRINRMFERGHNEEFIVSRLLDDEKDDWYKQLDSLVWHYAKLENKIVNLYQVDANGNVSDVVEQVLYYINKED